MKPELKLEGGIMTYQTCPKCEGTGTIWTVSVTQTYQTCPVCNGKMFIPTLTGQPPSDKKQEES